MTTVKVADLDAEGVYWGMKDKLLAEVQSGDVVFFADTFEHEDTPGVTYLVGGCDNVGGHYRWSGERFDPLPRQLRRTEPTAPSLERALYDMVRFLASKHGDDFPSYPIVWANHYENTVDGRLR